MEKDPTKSSGEILERNEKMEGEWSMRQAKKTTNLGSLPMKFPTATGFPLRNLKGLTMEGANALLRSRAIGEAGHIILSSPLVLLLGTALVSVSLG